MSLFIYGALTAPFCIRFFLQSCNEQFFGGEYGSQSSNSFKVGLHNCIIQYIVLTMLIAGAKWKIYLFIAYVAKWKIYLFNHILYMMILIRCNLFEDNTSYLYSGNWWKSIFRVCILHLQVATVIIITFILPKGVQLTNYNLLCKIAKANENLLK